MILIIVITCSDGAKPSRAERSTSSRGGTPTQSGCQPPVVIMVIMMVMIMIIVMIMMTNMISLLL